MRRLLLILLLPLVGLVTVPPAAALSCVDPESVAAGSQTLFTGRIRDYRDERLLVEVDEIWRGDVAPEVWLATELGYWSDLKAFRSGTIPDGYSSEKVFLFAPRERTNYPLTVSVCSMWDSFAPWGQDLKQFRPAVVRQPMNLPTVIEPDKVATPLSRNELRLRQAIAGLAVIVVLGGGIVLVRRRRAPAPGQGYSPATRPEDY